MKTKVCPRCDIEKELKEFHKDKSRNDGHEYNCKICKNEMTRRRYYENKENRNKQQKEYYLENREEILKQCKKYRDNNKEKIAKYFRERKRTDIRFKLLYNLRVILNKALNGKNKSLSTMFLIGCEIDYLMYHIQKQFKSGMNWDNYGFYGWHVDHIKPCAKFDLSKPEEQRKCFHYSNLQPLWAEENLSKGDNYEQ